MTLLKCLTALVLAASTVTVAPQIADACGGSYGDFIQAPRVHVLSKHTTPNGTRSFVALAPSDEKGTDREWTRLFPQSYDYAMVRDLGTDYGETFTLVGAKGSRVVRPSKRVLVSSSYAFGLKTQEAREIKTRAGDDFEIAIEGVNKNVSWVELADLGMTTQFKFAAKPQFELRKGETLFGTYTGYALGALQLGGRTYLVTAYEGTATAHWIQ